MTVRDLIDKNWDAICERKVYSIENGKTPDKKQYTTLRLYRWTGADAGPFEPVE